MEVDLSAFPIIRLDHIPHVDLDTLAKASEEIEDMLESSEDPDSKMNKYLQRQLDAMKAESMKRIAADRIQQLLNGKLQAQASDYSHITGSAEKTKKKPSRHQQVEVSESEKKIEMPAPNPKFKPMPLPSELFRSNSSAARGEDSHMASSSSSANTTTATTDGSSGTNMAHADTTSSYSKPQVQPLSFTPTIINAHKHEESTSRSTSSISTSRSGGGVKPKRGPTIEEDVPSKKSLDIVYKNFGSQFIVAATERKRRFIQPKKPEESPEEIKQRERLERRKQAMEKLTKRKGEREKIEQQKRERRRIERIKKEQERKAKKAEEDALDSSDSESVSGGDDEIEVTVDPKLVENLQKALKDEEAVADNTNTSAIKAESKDEDAEESEAPQLPQPPPPVMSVTTSVNKSAGSKSTQPAAQPRSIPTKALASENKPKTLTKSTVPSKPSRTANTSNPQQQQTQKAKVASNNPVVTGRKPRTDSEDISSNVPATPTSAPSECTEEEAPAEGGFQNKNIAALMMIRKMKEERNKVRGISSSSLDANAEDDGVPPAEEVANENAQDVPVEGTTEGGGTDETSQIVGEEVDEGELDNAAEREIMPKNTEDDTADAEADAGLNKDSQLIGDHDVQQTGKEVGQAEEQVEQQEGPESGGSSPLPVVQELYHQQKSGIYVFHYSPEQLPGLAAWKLDTVDNLPHWSMDVDIYRQLRQQLIHNQQRDAETEKIFAYKSLSRRFLPHGLILLAKACARVLLGGVEVRNEDDFVSSWQSMIQIFDEYYENGGKTNRSGRGNKDDDDDEIDDLFRTVSVCGNGYTICKKIEALLKLVFMSYKDQPAVRPTTISQQLRTEETPVSSRKASAAYIDAPEDAVSLQYLPSGSATGSRKNSLSRASSFRTQASDSSINSSRGPSRQNSARQDTEKRVSPRSAAVPLSHSTPSNDSTSIAYDAEIFPEPILATESNIAVTSSPSNTQQNNEQGDVPPVGDIQEAYGEQDEEISIATTVIRSDLQVKVEPPKVPTLPLKSSKSEKRSHPLRASKSSLSTKQDNNNNGGNAAVRLTDFYPHFGMIFPVAYHSQVNVKDDSSYARTLIECMQVQAKVYEEWIDIMRDYSTVFCTNNNSLTGDDDASDAAMEKSAEVCKSTNHTLHYRVKSQRSEVSNIVTDVFAKFHSHWEALPSGLGLGLSWNLLWTWSKPHINRAHLLVWQRVNHFEDSKQLTRKDLLKKNIQRYVDMNSKFALEFEIMPPTFILPHEYTQFVQVFTKYEMLKRGDCSVEATGLPAASVGSSSGSQGDIQNYWILKPVGLSRGRGISLVKDLSDVTYSQSSVIQKYIERPLCLVQYKFDLRIYVIVTSFKPLEAFIFRDGFARVSTTQYSLDPNDVNNKFIHLTNSSIQKHNEQDISKDNPLHAGSKFNDEIGGSKIGLLGENGLWKLLQRFQSSSQPKIDVDKVWKDICLLIVKSLVIVDDKMIHQPCCFELFGYDVLIDENGRPWLIEVNASPSLARENALDHRVKNNMMADLIDLLEIPSFDRAALVNVIKKRLGNIAKNRYVFGKNDPDLEQDLRDILGPDYIPRKYGELPKKMGNYERLCPETQNYLQVMKLKKKIIKTQD